MNSPDSSKFGGRLNRAPFVSAHPDTGSPNPQIGIDPFEQVNFKVPRGTRLRIKRLALDQGGISMMALFMQMLDDYEHGRRAEMR